MTSKGTLPASAKTAQAASRTLDILEFVGQQALPVSAARIVSACGIPRSTLRNLLRMLQARGYLDYQVAERGWTTGRRFLEPLVGGLDLQHGIAVLEVLGAGGGGLSREDVVERSGLTSEVVARALTALADLGLVVPCSDSTYMLGRRLLGLASRIGWVEALQSTARPGLTRLRDESGETASLFMEDSVQALYLDQVESRFALRCRGWVGRRVPLEGTSAGAAFSDASRVHIVADAVEAGVTAIACAAPGIEPAVGVSIIGPSWRLEERGLDRLAPLVQEAATDLAEAHLAARHRNR